VVGYSPPGVEILSLWEGFSPGVFAIVLGSGLFITHYLSVSGFLTKGKNNLSYYQIL
jgi:hypothetical protein